MRLTSKFRRSTTSIVVLGILTLSAASVPSTHATSSHFVPDGSVDIVLRGASTTDSAHPDTGCQSSSANETYARTVNGVNFSVTVSWVKESDCSHWASSLSTSSGASGVLLNIRGTSYDAGLGYSVSGGYNITSTSLSSGCNSTSSIYNTAFSGSNVPSGTTPFVIVGVGTSCSAAATDLALQDTVN